MSPRHHAHRPQLCCRHIACALTHEACFRDRRDAGRRLAHDLRRYAHRPDLIVVALPRGGVPIGFEVAHALGAPLDVFVVRTLGLPWHDKLAMGAIVVGLWYADFSQTTDEEVHDLLERARGASHAAV